MTDPLLLRWFEVFFCGESDINCSNMGRIEHPDAEANAPGCRGDRDYLFLYLQIKGRKILNAKYECSQCDPGMFVTGEILCNLIKGKLLAQAKRLTEDDFLRYIGEDSEELVERANTALIILNSAIDNYDSNPRESILDYYQNPHNWGLMDLPHARGYAENPSCGDMIEIGLSIEDQRINEARFVGKGCVISIAAASMLTESIEGEEVEWVKSLTEQDVLDLLGIGVTPGRRKCAFVGLRALRQAFTDTDL